MKIYYITENKRKIERAREICRNTNVEIEQIAMEIPEIQADNSREVARFSAKFAGEKLGKPVIKLDVGFYIRALNGFPGPFVKYINQWLKPELILEMMRSEKDRYCHWEDVLAFCDKAQLRVFSSREEGTIAKDVRGENGWGMDKIFIPRGQAKTKAELSDKERIEISNDDHWWRFLKFVENNNS
jgi:XTP/dITP diphosphohydrolase